MTVPLAEAFCTVCDIVVGGVVGGGYPSDVHCSSTCLFITDL